MGSTRAYALAAGLALAVGCAAPTYDVAYDCEQTIACQVERGETPLQQAACESDFQALYDSLPEGDQKSLDNLFLRCAEETGCAYGDCLSHNG